MALQSIGLGVAPSGAGGDAARTAFEKINANFSNPAHAASKLVQTSPTDTTAGALMAVGAFGWNGGAAIAVLNTTDADTLLTPGLYLFGSNGVNLPTPAMYPFVWVFAAKDGASPATKQVAYSVTNNRIATRTRFNGTWSSWREVYSQETILGTVSQSGGVPTGAIIERGSNANGEYIKWADGTLECWQRSVTVECVADVDLDVTWPLPAAFNAVNAAATCTLRSPATTNVFTVHKLQGNHTSAAACTMRVRFSVTQSYLLTFHAIGRWY